VLSESLRVFISFEMILFLSSYFYSLEISLND